ncbi:MAG: acyl-CoA desaturase [Candidatus Paceibacterota bacterium]
MTSTTPSWWEKLVLLLVVILPIIALPIGIIQIWGWGVDWISLALFAGFYIFTGFGVTVGYHRLFTHASFEAVRPLKIILAIAGSMALEGPVATWVARHNKHHRFADEEGDPHSPVHGFWHAHFGFLLTEERIDKDRYAKHIIGDPDLVLISRLFLLWTVLSLALPAVLGFVITGTASGALLAFLWGSLIRIGALHHVTWSINSVCHVFGTRRFNTQDQSRNNWICGILGGGEGWHNNHHALPKSAWHSLGQGFDPSYRLIQLFAFLRLAKNVNVPSLETIRRKESPQAKPAD